MANDAAGSRLTAAAKHFDVEIAAPVARTRTSDVHKVTLADGRPAALKLLTAVGADEAAGARWLAWRAGAGAARLYGQTEDAMLIEWLDGPTLGNIARAGSLDEMCGTLAGLLTTLQQQPSGPVPAGLDPLDSRFGALLARPLASRSAALAAALGRAQAIARGCLAGAAPPRPLHGDLHHDNIMWSERGWLAFDPKGVIGDPAYEVANLFRNPDGAPELSTDPGYHSRLASTLAPVIGTTERQLWRWAAAHAGLSIAWSLEAGEAIPADQVETLNVLIAGAD